MKTGVEQAVAGARADVLFVAPSAFGGSPLPRSAMDRLERIPGIKTLSFADGLLGTYQKPNQPVYVLAIEPGDFWLTMIPEVFHVLPKDLEALKKNRTGALMS